MFVKSLLLLLLLLFDSSSLFMLKFLSFSSSSFSELVFFFAQVDDAFVQDADDFVALFDFFCEAVEVFVVVVVVDFVFHLII